MSDNDQLKKSTANSTANKSNLSGKRRALLKGSAAMIPAVFTLKGGPAFAQAINSVNSCIGRDSKVAEVDIGNGTLELLRDTHDNWVRKIVSCRTLTHSTGPAPDPLTFDIYFPEPNTASLIGWLPLGYDGVNVTDTYSEFVGGPDPKPWIKDGNNATKFTSTDPRECYILVRVNELCEVVGLGTDPDGGTPYVTGSCWTSVGGTDVNA